MLSRRYVVSDEPAAFVIWVDEFRTAFNGKGLLSDDDFCCCGFYRSYIYVIKSWECLTHF